MNDMARGAPDVETPVNPYSLLEAVNRASDTAHTGWLIFLAIMTYLMIAVAGVTHKDLLLETPVTLPILQVNIQLAQFFQFAPIVLVLLHLGLVSQLALLARETLEFDHAIRLLETSDRRTHPLRLELNNFFFVQAIAGPQRSAIMSAFLHGMSWLTLVVLPVVLILYIQVVFLPYHDVAITWTHRIALLIDLAVLVLIGVFLTRAETSFFQAFFRTTSAHPFSFMATTLVLGLVAFFSLMVATVPGEGLDRLVQAVFGRAPADEPGRDAQRQAAGGFSLPFTTADADGSLFGIFRRNLVVTDTDLVVDKEQTKGEPSFSLRGRDLRFAQLDRSDLHQVDLTGADIGYASLVGTDLREAWLQCADVNGVVFGEDRAASKCVSARGTDFSRSKLSEAHMLGIDLTGAKLEDARLDGVELAYARLTGANFYSAHLEKADLTGGVQAQGANFLIAALQGADLTGAQLQFADFSSAGLQGAVLNHAQLQGAVLRDADLEVASLSQAKLHGTDLTGAKIVGADLRAAAVWLAEPPGADPRGLADFSDIDLRPLAESDVVSLKQTLERIDSPKLRAEVGEALAPVLNLASSQSWDGAQEKSAWTMLIQQSPLPGSDVYKSQLTQYLTDLICKPRYSNGSVATGIARRAQQQQFRGDMVLVYDRLKAADCAGSKKVPPKVLSDFASNADQARSN